MAVLSVNDYGIVLVSQDSRGISPRFQDVRNTYWKHSSKNKFKKSYRSI